MNWLRTNIVTIFVVLGTAFVQYGITQQKVDALESEVVVLKQQQRLHEFDAERHPDRRFMERVINQMDQIERRLYDISQQQRRLSQ